MGIKMKTLIIMVLGMIMIAMTIFLNLSCKGNKVPTTYSGPPISDELNSNAQKTTVIDLEGILGTKLEIPAYLPYGYAIREVYYLSKSQDNPEIYRIIFLISDQPIEWEGYQYKCQLVYEIDWNTMGAGLKMPWAEYIKSIEGRLEKKDNKYILWWESNGSKGPKHSTSRLSAREQFPKEELIEIAMSTFFSQTNVKTESEILLTFEGPKKHFGEA
jgi:hypothetical protein